MFQFLILRSGMDLDNSAFGLTLSLVMFLLIRELMLSALWRTVLIQTNDDHGALRYVAQLASPVGADAARNKAY